MADQKPHSFSDSPSNPNAAGGAGGRANLQELSLYRRAIRLGFNVTPETKERMQVRLNEILRDAKSERSIVAVSRVLATMESVTVAAVDTALRAQAQERLATEIEQLKTWRESCEGDAPKDTTGAASS
jgi:hypothetical protein